MQLRGGEIRDLTPAEKETCATLHLFLLWFEGAFVGTAPNQSRYPGVPLRPGDQDSLVTMETLVELGKMGVVQVVSDEADTKWV